MRDDLVARLRLSAQEEAQLGNEELRDIQFEAADVIERLRAEVARLGSFLHPVGPVIHGLPAGGASSHPVAAFRARTGLSWTQIAQLFGTTRKTVHRWADGDAVSPRDHARLDELQALVERSGHTDPAAVRQWFLSAERGSTRTRFAELVGPPVALVPEDGRRLADTLGPDPEAPRG